MRLNLDRGVLPYVLFPETAVSAAVVIHALPALSHVMEEAKADAALRELAHEIKAELAEGEVPTPEVMAGHGQFAVMFAKAIARQVIQSWDGIEDEDGSPAPVTPDRIDAFLDLAPVYDKFVSVYMARWLVLQSEKNAFAPSPTGTSVGAAATARPAEASAPTARHE